MPGFLTSLFCCLAVVFVIVRYVYVRYSADLKHPLIWICVGYLFLFPLRGIVVASDGSRVCEAALGKSPSLGNIGIALWLSVAGMAVLYGAVRFFERSRRRRSRESRSRTRIEPSILMAMYALGQALRIAIVYLQAGGIGAYLASNKDELMRGTSGLTLVAIVQAGLVAVPLLAAIRRAASRKTYVAVAVAVAVELFVAAISGSRFGFASVLLMVAIATYSRRPGSVARTVQYAKWIAITGALTAIAFVPLSTIRFEGVRGLGDIESSVSGRTFMERYITPVMERASGLDSVIIVVAKCPAVYPYTLFIDESKTIVAAPIPRAVWPNKPTISFGKTFSEKMLGGYYADDVSAAATLWGHGYMICNVPGIVFAAIVLGALVGIATRLYCIGGEYIVLAAAFTPMFLVVMESDMVSLFTSVFATVVVYTGLVWVGVVFSAGNLIGRVPHPRLRPIPSRRNGGAQ